MSIKLTNPLNDITTILIVEDNIKCDTKYDIKKTIILSKIDSKEYMSYIKNSNYIECSKIFKDSKISFKKLNTFFLELLNLFIDNNINYKTLSIITIGNNTKYNSLNYLFHRYFRL